MTINQHSDYMVIILLIKVPYIRGFL